ncbi:hypothetical protein KUCAC02_025953, partial [Chaenocephalus aceratus]
IRAVLDVGARQGGTSYSLDSPASSLSRLRLDVLSLMLLICFQCKPIRGHAGVVRQQLRAPACFSPGVGEFQWPHSVCCDHEAHRRLALASQPF